MLYIAIILMIVIFTLGYFGEENAGEKPKTLHHSQNEKAGNLRPNCELLLMSRELSEHGRKNRATQQKLRRPCLDNSIARNRGWFAAAMGNASVLIPQNAGG